MCGVSSIAVKGTEVNSEKWLRIKYFWTFEYPLIGYSDFCFGKIYQPSRFLDRVDKLKMEKVALIK